MPRCESPSSDPAGPSRPTMPGSPPWQFSTVFQCSVATSTSTPSRTSTGRAGRGGTSPDGVWPAPSEALLGLHQKLHPLDTVVAVEGERQVHVHDVAESGAGVTEAQTEARVLQEP